MARGACAVAAVVALLLTGCGGPRDLTADPVEPGEPAVPAVPNDEQAPASAGDGDGAQSPRGEGDAGEPGEDVEDLAEMAEDLATGGASIAPRDAPVLGADISWPQCPKGLGIPERRTQGMPLPLPEAEYVVIGLTNGPGFTPNPCLADQVDWVRERGLMAAAYSVVSYPDAATLAEHGGDGPFNADTEAGRLRNVGYQQAHYNIGSMVDAELRTPVVWIDVEPLTDFVWSNDPAANAAVVEGVARGYTDAGFRIGIYSTPYLWEGVVGDLTLGGVPEWRAAGETSAKEALDRCGSDWSIQGGDGVLGQWVERSRDQNLTCPGISADLGRWFHRY